jgi:ribose-phosphate pyrophosphokinase
MNVDLVDARVERFNDGEIFVEVFENVRDEDMFIIQPTSRPANDALMELLIIADALKRSSASRVTAVIPYFGYARQDRRSKARTPITAKLVANMLEEAGLSGFSPLIFMPLKFRDFLIFQSIISMPPLSLP